MIRKIIRNGPSPMEAMMSLYDDARGIRRKRVQFVLEEDAATMRGFDGWVNYSRRPTHEDDPWVLGGDICPKYLDGSRQIWPHKKFEATYWFPGQRVPERLPEDRTGVSAPYRGWICIADDFSNRALIDAVDDLSTLTYAVQHNPNCPSPYLVRLVGGAGRIDYLQPNVTKDLLGYGKTLPEAIQRVLPKRGK